MSEALQEYRQKASYRRGTVMGLTAAEAFMLVAFILLTLLVFWRVLASEERDRLLAENARLSEAVALAEDPERLREAVAFRDSLEPLSPDEAVARLSLVEDDKLRALVVAAQDLSEEGLLELTDLTRDAAFPGAMDKLDQLERIGLRPEDVDALQADLEKAQDDLLRLEDAMSRRDAALAETEAARDALDKRLGAFTETGQTPAEIRDMQDTLAELSERQQGLARTGAEIATTIEAKAGDRIAELGGQILPDGDVIFPDAVLFKANEAEIAPRFDQLLQSFCPLWFETLYEQRDALDTMQVEGHASSEYGGLPLDQAFVKNLDLSQRRAAAVFARCLALSPDEDITVWARRSMAAVGYSSARPILEDGIENRQASRRVVFALEPRTQADVTRKFFDGSRAGISPAFATGDDALRIAVAQLPEPADYLEKGYQELTGLVDSVRDGDTIEVEGEPIRIQGLHAPETNTVAGREAKEFVRRMLSGRSVTCYLSGHTTHDRSEGVCFEGGKDVAALIVAAGQGRDCQAFSGGRYQILETEDSIALGPVPDYC